MNNIGKMIASKKNSSYKIERLGRIMDYRRTHGYRDGFALMPTTIDEYRGKSVYSLMRYKKVLRQLNISNSYKPVGLDRFAANDYLNDFYSYSINPSSIHKHNRFVRFLKRYDI